MTETELLEIRKNKFITDLSELVEENYRDGYGLDNKTLGDHYNIHVSGVPFPKVVFGFRTESQLPNTIKDLCWSFFDGHFPDGVHSSL